MAYMFYLVSHRRSRVRRDKSLEISERDTQIQEQPALLLDILKLAMTTGRDEGVFFLSSWSIWFWKQKVVEDPPIQSMFSFSHSYKSKWKPLQNKTKRGLVWVRATLVGPISLNFKSHLNQRSFISTGCIQFLRESWFTIFNLSKEKKK